VGEIRKGIEISRARGDSQQADALELWLETIVRRFSNMILPIDDNVSDVWGRFYAIRNVPVIDSLMAATALAHNFTFVTRNVSDVQHLGVNLLNPFSD
jgi:predicted nucleic acid-binding protein